MMRYRRLDDGGLEPLMRPNVDTGMGLERLLTVLQGKQSVFETDLLEPWMSTVRACGPRTSSRCACSPIICGPAWWSSATGYGRRTPAAATCCAG